MSFFSKYGIIVVPVANKFQKSIHDVVETYPITL